MAFSGFLRRLFGTPPPPPPRLVALVNRCDDLEARIEYLSDELKSLRGRFTGRLRKGAVGTSPEPEPEPAGSPLPEGDGSPAASPAPPRPLANLRQVDLARRFRGF